MGFSVVIGGMPLLDSANCEDLENFLWDLGLLIVHGHLEKVPDLTPCFGDLSIHEDHSYPGAL